MMAFAERVSQDAYAMTDDDSRRLREQGLSDTEIVNIALAAAARNYYSRAIQALAVDVDVPRGSARSFARLSSAVSDPTRRATARSG